MKLFRAAPTKIMCVVASLPLIGCGVDSDEQTDSTEQGVQTPLLPENIPQFTQEMPIPRTFAPKKIWSNGQVIRHEYTVTISQIQSQMLPTIFPSTTVLAYGGKSKKLNLSLPQTSLLDTESETDAEFENATETVIASPGPIFDNTRGIPSLVKWRNAVTTAHFLPIDPTLNWANPATAEPPVNDPVANGTVNRGWKEFPPGYATAQAPVAIVTHNHGLVVKPEMDGIAEEWFTNDFQRGPSFVTRDYTKPNQQPGTQLFYHDHTMGMTRVNLFAGLAGSAYYIRDLASPLDGPTSTLPKGKYEVPLVIFDRGFFDDGQLNFPRTSGAANKKNAYWQPGDGANVNLVNGVAWPNFNVERRQYRFRTLAIGNGRTYTVQFDLNGVLQNFTLIGSDGGYLPQPQTVNNVIIATTERADILFDFSPYPAGTQIILRNGGGNPANTIGTIMRFTVQNTAPIAAPPTPALVPLPSLTPDPALRRLKTMQQHIDADEDATRSIDGLEFTAPTTEFPIIGSTEQWDIANVGGGSHQTHIHLIEFQVLNRQAFRLANPPTDPKSGQDRFLEKWHLLNGHRPVSRPIVVDPAPFLDPAILPALPYESGWKDTVRSPGGQVTRLLARWAPQEVSSSTPGVNQFPINPVGAATESWFLWHCHVLGHEDNDMMRKMPMIGLWASGKTYVVNTVVAHNKINYRVRVQHNSTGSQPPTARFDLWERVNNNDGTWVPQIIYARGDRVLHAGLLYEAKSVFQAQNGQTPNVNPALWSALPMTACGQISQFCAGKSDTPPSTDIGTCQATGAGNVEETCLTQLNNCLAECFEHVQSPCSGLCNNPTKFTVPDNTTFQSGALGTGAACFETTSELLSGTCNGIGSGRRLTVNGKQVNCNGGNWPYPLPTQRNNGFCIQVTAGSGSTASFQAF